MRLRRLAYCTVALGLVSTTTSALAAAKAKPACNLIVDKAGDGRVLNVLASDSLDIISGDVASGKKTVVGTLRLKKTAVQGEPSAALGSQWSLRFTVQGSTYIFWRRVSGAPANAETSGLTINNVQVPEKLQPKVTVTPTTITWTVSRATVAGLKKPKSIFTQIGSSTTINGTNSDAADSTSTYQDLAPSCLKAS